METCKECGGSYGMVYDTPDWMWKEVTDWQNGEGLLCILCFDEMARGKGIVPFWGCGNKEMPYNKKRANLH